jgi:hypothetical protein
MPCGKAGRSDMHHIMAGHIRPLPEGVHIILQVLSDISRIPSEVSFHSYCTWM